MIHYISPYRSDKDIGRANNECIERLGRVGDWICLTDADAMPMLPDYGTQIEEIIQGEGKRFGLIGCMTNRLGMPTQLHNGEFSNDWDIRNHRNIAQEIREQYGGHVEQVRKNEYIAGLFMLFPYAVWKKVGGFKEGSITTDVDFNRRVRACGGNRGLARGLYLFHAYRMGETDMETAKNKKGHLL